MWRLAGEVGLDQNSPYHYLVFCRDFARTSIVARDGHDLAGFATGYRRPDSPKTLFVWQIAVSPAYRRRGLGLAMLHRLGGRLRKDGVRWLEASVTASNDASRRLFQSFAHASGASCAEDALFPGEAFPTPHEAELLLRIGPI